jgi:hypothetical protein
MVLPFKPIGCSKDFVLICSYRREIRFALNEGRRERSRSAKEQFIKCEFKAVLTDRWRLL